MNEQFLGERSLTGQRRLRIDVAPSRCAYLVRAGSETGFRTAVDEACTRWGGATEPILAVEDGGTLAPGMAEVLHFANVEGLINVDVPDAEADAIAAEAGLPVAAVSSIDGSEVKWTTHPLDVGPRHQPGQICYLPPYDADLWKIAAAGAMSPGHIADLDAADNPAWPENSAHPLVRAQMDSETWLDRTTRDIVETYGSSAWGDQAAIIWCLSDRSPLDDCWRYWNVRALRPFQFGSVPMLLATIGALTSSSEFAGRVNRWLRRRTDVNPDVFIVSRSVPVDDLHALAAQLELQLSTDEVVRGSTGHSIYRPERIPPFTYKAFRPADENLFCDFDRIYGKHVFHEAHVYENETVNEVQSPVPFLGGRTLLRIEVAEFDHLPKTNEVAELCLPAADWVDGKLRIRTLARPSYYLKFRIPTVAEAVASILTARTAKFALSDKGASATALTTPKNIATLLQPGVFEILNEMRTPRSKELQRELKALTGDSDRTTDLDRLVEEWSGLRTRRYRRAASFPTNEKWSRLDVVESLAELGWAERGFEIKCRTCKLASFVPIDGAPTRGHGECPGCRTPQRYTEVDNQIAVFYRLDTLVDKAADQGVLPHVLAVGAIVDRYPHAWLLPGVDVWFDGPANPSADNEIDLVGVIDGRFAVGEVKTNSEDFTQDQIGRDLEMCRKLRADLYVMAATTAIAQDTVQLADSLAAAAGVELMTFEDTALRPNT